jgi:hypothetical protein
MFDEIHAVTNTTVTFMIILPALLQSFRFQRTLRIQRLGALLKMSVILIDDYLRMNITAEFYDLVPRNSGI